MSLYKFVLFFLVVFFVCSLLVGIAELNYLGPYASQSKIAPIFAIFGVKMETEAGSVTVPVFSQIQGVLTLAVNMVLWNYSVLDASTLGSTVRLVLLYPMSFAFLLSLTLTILSHVPVIGRGGGG